MKLRTLGAAALTVLAMTTFAATASATTLEAKGVKQTGAVTIRASLKAFSSSLFSDTFGGFANTCTASGLEWRTEVFTGGSVEGTPLFPPSFSNCTEGPVVVDNPGVTSKFTITNIAATTNGTVRWIGGVITTPSPFGPLSCSMAAAPGTDIGTLTGTAFGTPTLDINASLNCGFITGKWQATYTFTSPEGLGVTS
jgi:hypothetical protein